jgi:hypothetical protein
MERPLLIEARCVPGHAVEDDEVRFVPEPPQPRD